MGDDKTDLDAARVVVMPKRSFDVCLVIGFLDEVGDRFFDFGIILLSVRELEVLLDIN